MTHKPSKYLQRIHRSWRAGLYRLLRHWPRLAKGYLATKKWQKRLAAWWQRNNRHYGVWWRLGNGALAVLLLLAVVIPVLQQVALRDSYKLSADALQLVGKTDQTLTKQLTYDSSSQTYQFNKDAIKSDSSNPLANLKSQVGTASGSKNDTSLYALDVPEDFSKGVTYHDINSQLSFSLVPEFTSKPGKSEDGHLVYPLDGGSQAIYTLKNNGLKEDIVVPKATGDTMTFGYTLQLPKTLEAKIIPNSDGAIGIYSGDQALFGNISYGSSADQAKVEKARENAEKTTLVFGLPSPVIKAADGSSTGDASARFVLDGNHLSVVATGLNDVHSTVTIDPSVVVTSASDFQTGGNNDGNITFDTTNNQISRSGITGGSVASWTNTGATNAIQNFGFSEVAYNGWIYQIGGFASGSTPKTLGAPINSDGSIGSWTATTLNSPNDSRGYSAAVAYNGYMYIYGGYNFSTTNLDGSVEYAPINSDGTLGTWTISSNAMSYAVCNMGYAVYSGYLYSVAGSSVNSGNCGNSSTTSSYVQYAPIKANGDVGAWTTSANSITTARMGDATVAYNGYIYMIGGNSTSVGTVYSDVQYARLNSDGSVGTWATTNGLGLGKCYFGQAAVYNGYIYLVGGYDAGGNDSATVNYAPILANGTLGVWQITASINSVGRYGVGTVAYNGYLYMTGGSNGTPQSDTQYAKIDPAGMAGTWVTNSPALTRNGGASVSIAYNGFMYSIGGYNGTGATNVYYAAINASNGTIGSWTNSANALITGTGRYAFGATIYNGYLYVIAGLNSNGSARYDDVQYSLLNAVTGVPGAFHYTHNSTDDGTTYVSGILGGTRYGNNVIAYNGYLYTFGGIVSSTSQNDVQFAPLNSNGTVGAWHYTHNSTDDGTTFSAGFTNARIFFGLSLNGNYVYLTGGYNAGSTYYNDTQYAPLNTNGTIGTWTTNTTSFDSTGRRGLSTVISNGYIYVMGGINNSTYYNNVFYAPINSNASIGTWASTNSFTTARWGFGAATYNGYLYLMGGQQSTSNTACNASASIYCSDIQYAPISNGGSGAVTSWTNASNTYSNPRRNAMSAASNGYLYILGGTNTSGTAVYYSDVQYAAINADGSLGTWGTNTSLPAARFSAGVAVYNGRIYLLGGGSPTPYSSVISSAIGSGGTLGSWRSETSFAATVSALGVAVGNGYMYALGGNSSASAITTVYYSAISSTDGSLGAWNTASNALTTGKQQLVAIAYNGYLYEYGGANFNDTVWYTDLQYAPINTSTGDIGSWVSTASPAGAGSQNPVLQAYDGFMYVGTGYNGAANNNRIYTGTIQAGGGIGSWQQTTSITGNRGAAFSAIYNGFMYIAGGYNGEGTYYGTVQYGSLASMARAGHYSKLIDLGAAVNVTSISYNGAVPSGSSAITYEAAGTNGVLGTAATTASVSGTIGCLGTTTNTRYVWISVTLDDSYGYGTSGGFADTNTTPAKLTDFTVNYTPVHPPPNIRLRTGQTLQSGNLSALDTCYP